MRTVQEAVHTRGCTVTHKRERLYTQAYSLSDAGPDRPGLAWTAARLVSLGRFRRASTVTARRAGRGASGSSTSVSGPGRAGQVKSGQPSRASGAGPARPGGPERGDSSSSIRRGSVAWEQAGWRRLFAAAMY
jgi:hypothetical protein